MNKVAPQWIVKDVSASVQFYVDELDFSVDYLGDAPLFVIVSRGNFTLMLRQLQQDNLVRPNRIPFIKTGWHTNAKEAWDAYVWVDDADLLFEEFKSKNVSIIKPIQNNDYGNRDFEIEDMDGYILCFGKIL